MKLNSRKTNFLILICLISTFYVIESIDSKLIADYDAELANTINKNNIKQDILSQDKNNENKIEIQNDLIKNKKNDNTKNKNLADDDIDSDDLSIDIDDLSNENDNLNTNENNPIVVAPSSSSNNQDSKLDLDELNPVENNCRSKKLNQASNNSLITCSKIPLFCRSVCDSVKRINFDENLKRISAFSFGSYRIKQTLELNFKLGLKRIDSDAFNGLIIDSDGVLKINIGLDDENIDYQYGDDLDQEADSNDDQKQIDYDLEVPSTKSDILLFNSDQDQTKQKNLLISTNSFRGITIKTGGRLILNIKNLNRIEFDKYSLNSMKQLSNSAFMINIENSDLVLFKAECAKAWKPYTDDDIDNVVDYNIDNVYDYNDVSQKSSRSNKNLDSSSNLKEDVESVLFKLNMNSINKIVFEKESFSNLRLFNSSTFQVVINKFNDVLIGRSSFSQIIQQKFSNFELNLSSGKRLKLSDDIFSNLYQFERSKFVIYFGINESDLCIKRNTFSNLAQSLYSTLRITFLMNQVNSLIFNKESFYNINQDLNSFIQIYVLRANEFLLDTESVSYFNQSKLSTFEIWLSKSKSNFTIRSRAFSNVVQAVESSIKIGFTSSTTSFYIQSPTSFDQLISSSNSEVIYDFSQGTNFILKFPPRPVPRLLMINTENSERNNGRKQTVEELAWKLFPDLGRRSRPDTVNLHDYRLEADDFCKVADIPFDVLVKLNSNTECSCSVYYLYRTIRFIKERNDTDWLSNTPDCYKNKYLATIKKSQKSSNNLKSARLNQLNDLDMLEEMCKFNELVQNCRSMFANQQENEDSLTRLTGKCQDDSFETYKETDESFTNQRVISTTTFEYISTSSIGNNLNYVIDDDDSNEKMDIDEDETKNSIMNEDNSSESKESFDKENDDKSNKNYVIYDDDSDNKLIEIITHKNYPELENNQNKKYFTFTFSNIKNLFKNTTLLGFFLIGITSVILVGILVFILILIKLKFSRKNNGFSVYYDEEDEDDYHDNDGDQDNERSKGIIYNTPPPGYETTDKKRKQFNYSIFENSKQDDDLLDSADRSKLIVVNCNRKDSINSSILSLENELPAVKTTLINNKPVAELTTVVYDQVTNQNLMNIKPNPLSQV